VQFWLPVKAPLLLQSSADGTWEQLPCELQQLPCTQHATQQKQWQQQPQIEFIIMILFCKAVSSCALSMPALSARALEKQLLVDAGNTDCCLGYLCVVSVVVVL
jgi:hypothetical protein